MKVWKKVVLIYGKSQRDVDSAALAAVEAARASGDTLASGNNVAAYGKEAIQVDTKTDVEADPEVDAILE